MTMNVNAKIGDIQLPQLGLSPRHLPILNNPVGYAK